MHAFAWSTGVNAVTNQLHFNTLFELAASVASDTAHLPTPKLFEPLTDTAKFKFVISKLPKVSARYRTCFEEDVDKCLNLDDMFKFSRRDAQAAWHRALREVGCSPTSMSRRLLPVLT